VKFRSLFATSAAWREPVFARALVGKLGSKIKARMQQEAVIGGITEPDGGRHYFGALMLALCSI